MLTPGSALQNLCTFLFMKYACYIQFKIISLLEYWEKLKNQGTYLRWFMYVCILDENKPEFTYVHN